MTRPLTKEQMAEMKTTAADAATGYSKEVVNEVKRLNKEAIKTALYKARANDLSIFLMSNVKHVPAKVLQNIDNLSTKQKRRACLNLAEKIKIEDITVQGIKPKYTTAEAIEKKIEVQKARDKASNTHFKTAAKIGAYGAASVATLGVLPLTHASGKILDAYFARKGISVTQRNAAEVAALTGAFMLGQASISGDTFSGTFMEDAMSVENMDTVFQTYPELTKQPVSVIAFAKAYYEPGNIAKEIAFEAIMAAAEKGVHPLVTAAIINKETGNLRDVDAKSKTNKVNTAINLFQMTRDTKLTLLTRYADQIDFDGDTLAKEAVNALVSDYKANKRGLRTNLQNNKVKPEHLLALQTVDHPRIAGQLFAMETLRLIPEASIDYIEAHGLEAAVEVIGEVYQPHLLGPYGAEVLQHIADTKPNTNMRNQSALNAIHNQFNTNSKFEAGEYYSTVLKYNSGVFPRGELSAEVFESSIAAFASKGATQIIADMEKLLEGNPSVYTLMAKNPNALKHAVPEETTLAEVAATKLFTPRQRATLSDVMTATAEFTSNAFDTISDLTSDVKDSTNDNTATVPVPAESPNRNFGSTIEDIILEAS